MPDAGSQGARDKLEQLYSLYRELMFRVAYRILKNEEDAKDAVQNAALSIAENLSGIDELTGAKTRGFVAVITERKAIDLYRDRKKRESAPLEEAETGIPFPDAGEHDLTWCVSQLPPRYREVIYLKYSYGYSVREIADMLGISHAAASKLDQRAKNRLYDLCVEEGIL